MNSLAIVNAVGRVVTFVRPDVPEGWTPPNGCTAVPGDQLPPGWQYEPQHHDMADVRRQRNERLTASDWTQVADAPVDRSAWAAYRQALRDLPQTYTGQGPIPWPTAPDQN
jgi:hypothetical protein